MYRILKVWIGLKKKLPSCNLAAANFGVILSPHCIRGIKHISQELEWMHMEELSLNLLP